MSVLVNRGRQTIISPRGPITTRGGLCMKAKHPLEDAVWLGGWLTSPPLSWGGRWGDRPTAGAPRTCWGTLGKQQALRCSSPVRRSPRRCRWWRCCWSCPVEEHRTSVSVCRGAGVIQRGEHAENRGQSFVSISEALLFCFIIITPGSWHFPSGAVICVFSSPWAEHTPHTASEPLCGRLVRSAGLDAHAAWFFFFQATLAN